MTIPQASALFLKMLADQTLRAWSAKYSFLRRSVAMKALEVILKEMAQLPWFWTLNQAKVLLSSLLYRRGGGVRTENAILGDL